MALSDITSRQAVLDAIGQCDRLGKAAFLKRYGFGPSKNYFLMFDGREYDSKAIAGVAHGYQFPDQGPLSAKHFSGGMRTVQRVLENLGFELQVRGRPRKDFTS
jgi:hypothetical protein